MRVFELYNIIKKKLKLFKMRKYDVKLLMKYIT